MSAGTTKRERRHRGHWLLAVAIAASVACGQASAQSRPADPTVRYYDKVGHYRLDLGENWVVVKHAGSQWFLNPLRERAVGEDRLRSDMTVLFVPHKSVGGEKAFGYFLTITTQKNICPGPAQLTNVSYLDRMTKSMLAKILPPGGNLEVVTLPAERMLIESVDVPVLRAKIMNSEFEELAHWALIIVPGGDQTFFVEAYSHPNYKAEAGLAVRHFMKTFSGAKPKYSSLSIYYELLVFACAVLVLGVISTLAFKSYMNRRRKRQEAPVHAQLLTVTSTENLKQSALPRSPGGDFDTAHGDSSAKALSEGQQDEAAHEIVIDSITEPDAEPDDEAREGHREPGSGKQIMDLIDDDDNAPTRYGR